MDTNEINFYLKNFKQFKGTYPRDMLPKTIPNNSCIVINTDKSTQPGQHWVAVFKNIEGTVEYFDSFGLPPLLAEIIKFLDRISPDGWYYNKITLQSVYSDTCGMYSVYYLTARCRGLTIEEFISIFSNKPKLNDFLAKILYKIQ
jgi:hypothetical protein